MRGSDAVTGSMFAFVDIEARIREDHPIRTIRRIVNDTLATLDADFAAMYAEIGRPSIAPERLLRGSLLQMFFTIRSERLLMERIDYDLMFRWFVGLGIDDAVWNHSTYSKNRDRLLEADIARKFLARIIEHPEVSPLLSDEHFTVDGTLIHAWASLKSFVPKAAESPVEPKQDGTPTAAAVLEPGVEACAPAPAASEPAPPAPLPASEQSAVVDTVGDAACPAVPMSGVATPAEGAAAEVVTGATIAADVTEAHASRNADVDFKGQKRTNDTHASTTDPEARLYRKGPGKEARLSFMGHALTENRHGLVVGTTATLATGTAEREAALAMLDARLHCSASVPCVARVTCGADKGYDVAQFVGDLRARKVTPHVAQKMKGSAIDGRTTRHDGYAVSQRRRKLVEEPFGWGKTIGGLARPMLKGVARIGFKFTFTMAGYNLVRLPKLFAGRIASAATA
jgi:transposase